jgi:hypothetical protein
MEGKVALAGLVVVGVLVGSCADSTSISVDVSPPSTMVESDVSDFDDARVDATVEVPQLADIPYVDGLDGCPYPIWENKALAYRFGLPAGWTFVESGGTLVVSTDDSATTAFTVYTAVISQVGYATWFLGSYLEAIGESLGGTMSWTPIVESQGRADTAITATIANRSVSGTAVVFDNGGFMTAKLVWSPTFDQDQQVLYQVADCFQRVTVLDDEYLAASTAGALEPWDEPVVQSDPWGPVVPRRDQMFSFVAPSSWSSTVQQGDSNSQITLVAPGNDAALVFIFSLFRYQPDEEFLVRTLLQSFGISAAPQRSSTPAQGASLYEFSGVINGQNGRGTIAIRIVPYLTFFANYVTIATATNAMWDAAESTLGKIAASATVTDASANLQQLPPLPNLSIDNVFGSTFTQSSAYRRAVEDRASENWAEAMRGYVTVESPSTGDRWDVPLNSYNPSGGGYFRELPGGGVEQLIPR